MEKQITQIGPLLKPNGELAEKGWSPQALLDSNLEYVNFYKLKFQCGQLDRFSINTRKIDGKS